MALYFADAAWLPHGWASSVRIAVDDRGSLSAVDDDAERGDAQYLGRYVLPGMPNLHSHAFQRAMAGLAERQTHSDDSFWTWRETMYAFAGRIDPDAMRAIALVARRIDRVQPSRSNHCCAGHARMAGRRS